MKDIEVNSNQHLNSRHVCKEANETSCEGIFDLVHKCNSDFVNHAMQLSDPFKMCTDEITFVSYRGTMDFYNKLFTTTDPKNATNLCSDEFLSKNIMNVINNFVGYSKTAWEKANCDDCYGGVVSPIQNFSRNTIEFIVADHTHNECVQNITRDPNVNNSVVCTACESKYEVLNNLYEQIKKSTGNKVCFDLVDKVSPKLR